jgi:hypothetical protein
MLPVGKGRLWLSVLCGIGVLAFTGCGAVANSRSTSTLAQGNWSLNLTSSNSAVGTFYVGGNIAQNSSTLSATMYVARSSCFDVSVPLTFTGTLSGQQVTLASSAVNGEVISITATVNTSSSLSGTYTVTGNSCAADSGTLAANVVPAISGTWSGPVVGSGGPSVTLALALTQAGTASSDGTFALTGTATYTGSTCSVSGTVTGASVAGPYVIIGGTTVETDGSQGTFAFNNVLLNSSRQPASMTGTYDVTFGNCQGDSQSLTLTKTGGN